MELKKYKIVEAISNSIITTGIVAPIYKLLPEDGKWTDEYLASARIHQEPFYNCQIYALAYAKAVFGLANQEEAIAILKLIANRLRKQMMIIDVRREYASKVEAIFPAGKIKFKQAYTSTNSSEMVMYLLHMDWLIEPLKSGVQ